MTKWPTYYRWHIKIHVVLSEPYILIQISLKYVPKGPITSTGSDNGSAPNRRKNIIWIKYGHVYSLQWRHNGHDGISNHQPHHCLLNHLFRRRSNKTSKLGVTGLCGGNSLGTGEFPTQMASNAENGSIWWCHHVMPICITRLWCFKIVEWYQLLHIYYHITKY